MDGAKLPIDTFFGNTKRRADADYGNDRYWYRMQQSAHPLRPPLEVRCGWYHQTTDNITITLADSSGNA